MGDNAGTQHARRPQRAAMSRRAARRVTVYPTKKPWWRYRVQGMNWRTLETSGEFQNATKARKHAEGRWPGIEIVVNDR